MNTIEVANSPTFFAAHKSGAFVPEILKSQKNTRQQLSWSKVSLFLQCVRCFYLEQKLGIKRPGMNPDSFAMHNAIDAAMKREFDYYRREQEPHPLMIEHGIKAIPLAYKLLKHWRGENSYEQAAGMRYFDSESNLEFFGYVDDVWINNDRELIMADYKTTARPGYNALNGKGKWGILYKQQLAFYAWLFQQMEYLVHPIGYFVCATTSKTQPFFNDQLKFESTIVPYEIDMDWVEGAITRMRKVLDEDIVPFAADDCEYCKYQLRSALQ